MGHPEGLIAGFPTEETLMLLCRHFGSPKEVATTNSWLGGE